MEVIIDFLASAFGVKKAFIEQAISISSVISGLFITLFGFAFSAWLYVRGHIPDHITFSLNTIEDDKKEGPLLRIRTVQHLPRTDVVPSNFFFNIRVWLAQRKCCEEQSFIVLKERDRRRFFPQITSAFSALFADGFLAESKGLPVKRVNYLISTHYECTPNGHPSKLHCFIVPASQLERYKKMEFCESVRVELKKHRFRAVRTLHQIALKHAKEKNCVLDEDERLVRHAEGVFRD